jgi:hypothetical protein
MRDAHKIHSVSVLRREVIFDPGLSLFALLHLAACPNLQLMTACTIGVATEKGGLEKWSKV